MQRLNRTTYKDYNTYPEKILQFGEGNFLRGFVDWQIQVLNEKTDFNGSVVVVQPRGSEKIDRINRQDGLFTLYLQGLKDGKPVNEHMVIDSISRGINLFTDYQDYLKLAASDELRFIISNTTEAGIVFDPDDKLEDRPQRSFPGKLTAFLYHRFLAFDGDVNRGCILIPCELIENNGGKLKEVVLKYASHWNLDSEFTAWIDQANTFCSSLVDRIVPGYPTDSIEEKTAEIGFQDELMVVGEQYHLWAIEGPDSLKQELPVAGTGLNTLIVDDLTPFRTRKVRILNGAHTAMTPVAYLSGLDTVEEAVNDPEIGLFIKELIAEEIIPTFEGDLEELTLYAGDVLNRFANPFIKHYLMSISLNSISKFKTRNLPALLDYVAKNESLPKRMVFSLSSLIYFYHGKRGEEPIQLQDQPEIVQFFQAIWQQNEDYLVEAKELAEKVLSEQKLWEMDLASIPGLVDAVSTNLLQMEQKGVRKALKELYGTLIR
ncbi:altronate oxidoreductase [Bacillus sp. AFS076308]|uniref:tagaturonate reductase n=1 Tax=unclassified Bacillus (in: firmicutes) TaxID=185979 RepID=UPI000BF7E1B1|nr:MULTISPECIES: tagaturonate reductase [unclassified Bacillus (in: firmicutes)]PFO06872.1 altronate oxidoreductase [Bacillus sp. AFS076308]